MNIVEKNDGTKIDYSVDEDKLTLADEMTMDLSKYERDYPVHLDICENSDDILVIGISEWYVAQIDIPARQYTETTQTVPTDQTDADGNPIFDVVIQKTPVPFSMDNVTLTLWALEGENING